jgi:hypothetical protein
MVQDILWKADSHSACQTVVCFLYGTQRFITMLIKALHLTLSWASRIQSPHWPPSPKSHVLFQLLRSCQRTSPGPRRFETFHSTLLFYGLVVVIPLAEPPSWRTTPCRLSATASSVYTRLPSISGGLLLNPQPEVASCGDYKRPT